MLDPVALIGGEGSVARVKGSGSVSTWWEWAFNEVPVNRQRSNDGTKPGKPDRTRNGQPVEASDVIRGRQEDGRGCDGCVLGGGASQVPEIVAWSRRKGMQPTNTMQERGVTNGDGVDNLDLGNGAHMRRGAA